MAVATGQDRDRAVARPPWVRRQDNQHEGIVAGIMLMLVIVGIVIFLFWVPLIRMIATASVFGEATVPTNRPAEGATPAGPPVVVSLDQPVWPSQASVDEGAAAAGDSANPDQPGVAEPAPSALLSPNHDEAAASESGDSAAAEAAAARDAAETARAAEAAGAENDPAPEVAAAPPATPTAVPAATATPPAAVAPTSVAATSDAASGRRARVVRTGGRGVILYSAPRQGARMPAGILEGTVVSILGTSGGEWTQVQGNGKTGWVRSEYLAPAN